MPFPEPTPLVDRNLVFTFFWRFAALEAALIADPRFRHVSPRTGAPEPSWKQFKEALEGDLRAWDSQPFREAATELLECNVRRQVVRDGIVNWVELIPSDSPVASTIDTLKCVRNSLFHGGKYSGGEMDISRDNRILRASLNVLNECYELHYGIRGTVDDVAQAA